MLVAISGSQGAGKSTILTELAGLGFNVIERKTARSIMTEMFPGMSLDDIYANPITSIDWQNAILHRKLEDEKAAMASDKLWFGERSYADLFSYALMAVGKNNAYSDWLDEYFEICKHYNQAYLHVFYIAGGIFKPVADGVRGTNKHYQTMIDQTLTRVTQQMFETDGEHFGKKFTTIFDSEISARTHAIASYSVDYYLGKRCATL